MREVVLEPLLERDGRAAAGGGCGACVADRDRGLAADAVDQVAELGGGLRVVEGL
ncbi:MAG: hypothetical protein LCI03_06145 [Actinobacteria bacterium]|nr:hypothetical protein [Actinomycetota bacterium]